MCYGVLKNIWMRKSKQWKKGGSVYSVSVFFENPRISPFSPRRLILTTSSIYPATSSSVIRLPLTWLILCFSLPPTEVFYNNPSMYLSSGSFICLRPFWTILWRSLWTMGSMSIFCLFVFVCWFFSSTFF